MLRDSNSVWASKIYFDELIREYKSLINPIAIIWLVYLDRILAWIELD